MLQPEIAAHLIDLIDRNPWLEMDPAEEDEDLAEEEDVLEIALDLLEQGRPTEADNLLTAALLENPVDQRLWLAAGICRLRRGVLHSAAAAFEMSAWLSDDPEARALLSLCEEISL